MECSAVGKAPALTVECVRLPDVVLRLQVGDRRDPDGGGGVREEGFRAGRPGARPPSHTAGLCMRVALEHWVRTV